MSGDALGLWGVPLAIFGGAVRVSTPYLFVSLGECITEKSGRVNLGLEGNLFLGALAGFAVSYQFPFLATSLGLSPSLGSWLAPWLGVLAAGCIGLLMGVLHALIC